MAKARKTTKVKKAAGRAQRALKRVGTKAKKTAKRATRAAKRGASKAAKTLKSSRRAQAAAAVTGVALAAAAGLAIRRARKKK